MAQQTKVVFVVDLTQLGRLGLGALAVLAVGVPIWMAAATVPNSFTDGTVASAAAVNGNFEQLASDVTTLEGAVSGVQTGLVGQVASFAGSSCPTGWLAANGSEVSRTTYAALFSYVGTTYGAGNGSTTFRLPDLRGEFIRGLDAGRGIDAGRALGSSQISTQVAVDDDALHVVGAIDFGTNDLPALGYEAAQIGSVAIHYNTATSSTVAPASYARSIRPRNVALLYCIRH